jgi:tetratricopeptide (TPR) repeat protein
LADRDVETICAKCLEREPQARYRSAADLAEDLERWLEGRPIVARPVSPPVRIWRWSKRNPKLAGSVAACAVAAAAAVVWQVESRRLAATVREKQLATHSTTVLPFLDLDNASADVATSKTLATALQAPMSKFGPTKILAQTEPFPEWTGAGIADEVESAVHRTGSRTVFSGTIRRIPGGVRISLRLISENGTDVLGKWTLNLNEKTSLHQALLQNSVAESAYAALDGRSGVIDSLQNDPTMLNETSRGYFNAGRALLDRRTVADIDRAIACFEAAIRGAPRSVAARSYLAMAYMGRNYLLANSKTIEKAYETAQEAIALAPQNPTANRGLCYVAEARGRYTEALEYGLRSIELGDQSERALGQIAYAWKMLGRPDKAILWYKKAKASNRQPADYDALLGDCYVDLGLDIEAKQAYQTAANFRPDLPEGWMGLVYLKLINADFMGARALFAERSQEYTAFPVATHLGALVNFFSRSYSEAGCQFEQLSRDNPGGNSQHYGAISYAAALARIRQEENRVEEADDLINASIASDLKQLERLQPADSAEVLYRLAADQAIARNVSASLQYLKDSIAKGWLDYRSPRVDPRFDTIANDPWFKQILDDLATRVADLRRQGLTDKVASTKNVN